MYDTVAVGGDADVEGDRHSFDCVLMTTTTAARAMSPPNTEETVGLSRTYLTTATTTAAATTATATATGFHNKLRFRNGYCKASSSKIFSSGTFGISKHNNRVSRGERSVVVNRDDVATADDADDDAVCMFLRSVCVPVGWVLVQKYLPYVKRALELYPLQLVKTYFFVRCVALFCCLA